MIKEITYTQAASIWHAKDMFTAHTNVPHRSPVNSDNTVDPNIHSNEVKFWAYYSDADTTFSTPLGLISGYETTLDDYRFRGIWVDHTNAAHSQIYLALVEVVETAAQATNATKIWGVVDPTKTSSWVAHGFAVGADYIPPHNTVTPPRKIVSKTL